MKTEDLTGNRYNRLTVTSRADDYLSPGGQKHSQWNCVCDCGKKTVVATTKLKSGSTKSCGCYKRDEIGKSRYKHGKSRTRLFRIWEHMKMRCYNPNFHKYYCYGARGITICDDWKQDFMSFYDWAIEHGYSDCLSIDRIDVNGNYEPDNCRWATNIEQMNNKRTNRKITYSGKTQTTAQWARELGINAKTLETRMSYGWSIEKTFTYPVHIGGRYKCEA